MFGVKFSTYFKINKIITRLYFFLNKYAYLFSLNLQLLIHKKREFTQKKISKTELSMDNFQLHSGVKYSLFIINCLSALVIVEIYLCFF